MKRYQGKHITKYQVATGQVWQFEKGVLVCGSALDPSSWDYIQTVDCVYVDPPWNQGNMKMFYGFAGKEIELEFYEFLRALARQVMAHTKESSHVAWEVGMKQRERVTETLEAEGFELQSSYTMTYGSPPRQNGLLSGTFHTTPVRGLPVHNLHGKVAIRSVINAYTKFGFDTLLDCCCGKLDFLIEALYADMSVYGIELIPSKLSFGLSRLEKAGFAVKRVK